VNRTASLYRWKAGIASSGKRRSALQPPLIACSFLATAAMVAGLLRAQTAWAAGQTFGDSFQYQGTAPAATISIWGVMLQLVLSLAVVIGLVLILVKFLQKTNPMARQDGWARILDRTYVGPHKMLVLAEIFGKVYVLGVTEHSITTLMGEEDIDLSQVKQIYASAAHPGNPFLQVLDNKIGDLRRRFERRGKDGSPR
jgi:flagellar biosynthetic protein FliO